MNVRLMFVDRDFDPQAALPPHAPALVQDLALETLAGAMGGADRFLTDIARRALLGSVAGDVDTIRYRQAVLRDCLRHPAAVRELYALACDTLERKRRSRFGMYTRLPSSILHGASDAMQIFTDALAALRTRADAHEAEFESVAFRQLFSVLRAECSDEYLGRITRHLADLEFRHGLLVSMTLAEGHEGANHVLRVPSASRPSWLRRTFGRSARQLTIRIADRDEAGARALSELRERGTSPAANALAQSVDHVHRFFEQLRGELAFYVGCLNLHEALTRLGCPIAFPEPAAPGTRRLRGEGLYDVTLALTQGRPAVGNAIDGTGRNVVVITGANQGGKSTFLRGLGVATIMMHAGLFVGAASFMGEVGTGLFTHYRREEDATLAHGKLDEELGRFSELVDQLTPNAVVLFNESFASTNEREGSEIARQVVDALAARSVRVWFVTHLYEFARTLFEQGRRDVLFLRAERQPTGERTFRLAEGPPRDTSHGDDLYRMVFGGPGAPRSGSGASTLQEAELCRTRTPSGSPS